MRGANFFFAPQGPRVADNVPFSQVERIQRDLGAPAGEMQSTPEDRGPNEGYCLYSRPYQNGIVFLNLTGKRKTIALPGDRVFYARSGQRVTQIVLDDLQGDYVLTHQPGMGAP
ncbi:MAG: hypothetical protein NZ557_05365 [Chthonomonadaceae bacterium]|nr:hypothetical protein [Chthonomonadaceae bacterium]